MKLSNQLIVSFTGVIVLLLAIGMASQHFNGEIKNEVVDENKRAFRILEISNEMESYLYQSFVNVQYFLDLAPSNGIENGLSDTLYEEVNKRRQVEIALQGLRLNVQKINQIIADSASLEGQPKRNASSVVQFAAQLQNRSQIYASLVRELLESNAQSVAAGKEILVVTLEPYFRNTMRPMMEKFRVQVRENLDRRVQQLNARLSYFSNVLLFATLISFLCAIAIGYALYNAITRPLQTLAEAAKEIGQGNLSKRIPRTRNDEIGELGKSFNRMAEDLSETTFSKVYVDEIFESMGDGVVVTDENLIITKMNSAFAQLIGHKKHTLIGHRVDAFIPIHKNRTPLFEDYEDPQEPQNFEVALSTNYDKEVIVSVSTALIYGSGKNMPGMVWVLSDITQQKQSAAIIKESLDEKKILLAEIHHRVKNNLAVISGFLQLQQWNISNPAAKGVLQECQLRVQSIALVHEKLYQSQNLSRINMAPFVSELVREVEKTFRNDEKDISCKIRIDDVRFTVNQAIPCSLLINEIVVNAYKHAFKDEKEGTINIALDLDEGEVRLKVWDDGQGLAQSNSSKKSLGMSIIKTLVKQLSATITIENTPGATFTIVFPLKTKADDTFK